MIFFSSAPSIRSHGFAVAVTVAAGNDISWNVSYVASRPGPVVELGETELYSARATQSGEHCVVQQIFFRLVGILARTSPAGNAYAPIFFCRLEFF